VFSDIYTNLSVETTIHTFSLENYGYIVVLQPEDNVRDLSEIGLPPASAGLIDVAPEFVIKDTLVDGTYVYRIGILFNNEWMLELFSIAGQFDEEVETWLASQCITV